MHALHDMGCAGSVYGVRERDGVFYVAIFVRMIICVIIKGRFFFGSIDSGKLFWVFLKWGSTWGDGFGAA